MLVIKVWCLPKQTEDELRAIHKNIVSAVVNTSEIGLKGEDDMTVLFPPDMMAYGIGSEIIIEVTGLFEGPKRTHFLRNMLAINLAEAVRKFFPEAIIGCFVYPFNPDQGFWSSKI